MPGSCAEGTCPERQLIIGARYRPATSQGAIRDSGPAGSASGTRTAAIGPRPVGRAALGEPDRPAHAERGGIAGGSGEEVSWMRNMRLGGDARADQQRKLEEAREAFTAHAALYVLVMAALLVLNLF